MHYLALGLKKGFKFTGKKLVRVSFKVWNFVAMDERKDIRSLLEQLHDRITVFQKADIRDQLVEYVNYLLLYDFNRLVQLLYQVDVDESRLKELLQGNREADIAHSITDEIIERQLKKKTIPPPDVNPDPAVPDDGKW
jgi:hypothetical protein